MMSPIVMIVRRRRKRERKVRKRRRRKIKRRKKDTSIVVTVKVKGRKTSQGQNEENLRTTHSGEVLGLMMRMWVKRSERWREREESLSTMMRGALWTWAGWRGHILRAEKCLILRNQGLSTEGRNGGEKNMSGRMAGQEEGSMRGRGNVKVAEEEKKEEEEREKNMRGRKRGGEALLRGRCRSPLSPQQLVGERTVSGTQSGML